MITHSPVHTSVRTPLVLLLTLLFLLTSAPPWASAAESASFTAGGVVFDGVRYARQGDTVTLSVQTSTQTRCVEVTGAHEARQTSDGGQTSWSFSFPVGGGDGVRTVSAQATSQAHNTQPRCVGNTQGTAKSASYVADNTPPTLSGALQSTNAGLNGWYVGDATVAWTCSDNTGGSGIAAGACPVDSTVTGEGDNLSASQTLHDRVGNSATTTVQPIKIDRTPPVTTAVAPEGWSASNVYVQLDADDSLSGVAATYYKIDGGPTHTYSSEIPFTEEGEYELTYWSTDVAGNVEAAKTVEVKIDKTSPTISSDQTPAKNTNGWNNSPVTVEFTCADALSGIDECTGPQTVSTEVENEPVVGTAKDNAGNTNQATHYVSIDTTAPMVTTAVTGAAGTSGWYVGPVTVDFTCTDPVSNSVASGIPTGGCPGPQTLSSDGTDLSTTPVTVTDAADNESAQAQVTGINIDQTKPISTISGVPSGWVNASQTITLSADDGGGSGVASIHYQINGGTPEPYDDPFPVDAEGVTTITYWSVDVAGNIEVARNATVSIDTIAPSTQAAGFVHDTWTNQPVTVTLAPTDSDGSGVSGTFYRLNDGATTAYIDPFEIGHGIHTLRYWSQDVAGNVEDENVATIKVDTIVPTLVGTATAANLGGGGWYTDDITVTWACSDDDSGIDGDCPGNSTVAGEGDSLSASASISDVAGNSTTTVVPGLKIDRTPPNTTSNAPAGWQTETFQVELDASDSLSGVDATYYRVDGGSQQTYTGPIEFPDDGAYELSFWSVDVAGNLEAVNTATIEVDRTKPEITSSQNPLKNAAGWNNSDVTVSFDCSDATSGIASCTDPVPVTDEVEDHGVNGTAVDNAGNSASTTHYVSIDKTRPTVTATASGTAGNAGWYVSDVTVNHACEDPVSNGVASGIPSGACPSSQTLNADGQNLSSTSVTVFDTADNESLAAQATGINIDKTPPITTASGVPAGWTNANVEVTLGAADAGSGVAATYYTVNGGAAALYSAPLPFTDEGVYALTYWSVDVAGNVEAAKPATVQIDKTAPITLASGVPVGWTNENAEVTLTPSDLGGSEVAATYYTVNGGAPALYSAPLPFTDEGVYALTYWSVDHAGNVEEANLATVQIDKTAPTTTDDAPVGWQTSVVTVTLTAEDAGGSGVADTRYSFDAGVTSQPYTAPILVDREGTSTLTYWSEDEAGNIETAKQATIQVDLTNPAVVITAPQNGSSTPDATVTVSGMVSDAHSGVAAVTVNGTPATLDLGAETFSLAGVALDCGGNTITAVATDNAGRTGTSTVTVTRACASLTKVHSPLQASSDGNFRPNDVKRGRVVPVKVELEYREQLYTGASAVVGNPTISVKELPTCANDVGIGSEVQESAGSANTGHEFRWSDDGFWIYNLATDKMTVGKCYRIDVRIDGQRASNSQWAVLRVQR